MSAPKTIFLLGVLTVLLAEQVFRPDLFEIGPSFWMVVATIGIAVSGAIIEEKSEVLFPKLKFLVWALGTSLAEIVVCIVGGIRGEAHMGMATVLGSDAVNIAFGGFVALLAASTIWWKCRHRATTTLRINKYAESGMAWLLVGTGLTAGFVLSNHVLFALAAIVATGMAIRSFWNWSLEQPEDEQEYDNNKNDMDPILLVVGFALMILASHVLVDQMSLAATNWGVSEFLVSQLAGAFGTSLPEFGIGLSALMPLLFKVRESGGPKRLMAIVIGVFIMAAASNAVDMMAADAVMAVSLLAGLPGVAMTSVVVISTTQAILLTAIGLWAVRSKAGISTVVAAIMVAMYLVLTAAMLWVG